MNSPDSVAYLRAPRLTIRISRSADALRVVLHGDADTRSSDVLASVLGALDLESVATVHIEAAELHLFDVAAIRHLVLFVRRMRHDGRRVEVTSSPEELRETARLLGVDTELGLA